MVSTGHTSFQPQVRGLLGDPSASRDVAKHSTNITVEETKSQKVACIAVDMYVPVAMPALTTSRPSELYLA